jgi:hypothetical protein
MSVFEPISPPEVMECTGPLGFGAQVPSVAVPAEAEAQATGATLAAGVLFAVTLVVHEVAS